MQTEAMIPASEFCIHHNIELSFIYSLHDSGLIEIAITEEKVFVPVSQLDQLEKLVRMHYMMDINLEGMEAITHILQRMNDLERKIRVLDSRLRMYED